MFFRVPSSSWSGARRVSVTPTLANYLSPSAPQQYHAFLGAPGGGVPASGQRSPPSQFRKEDGLQAAATTAAILNLSTRYRKNMEAVAGRPLETSTKVIKLDHLERSLMWSFLKECVKREDFKRRSVGRGKLGAPVAEAQGAFFFLFFFSVKL